MGCCSKVPYRVWIGVMIFLTTYINYTTRANQSLSITAMVKKKKSKVAECLKDKVNATASTAAANTTDSDMGEYGKVYDWDERIQGNILGSYFWGYFAGSPPSGLVAEWLGPFWTIFIATVVSGVMNSLSVYAADLHYGALLFCRFIIGLVGAFVYPALHVLIARWAPPAEKGKFVGAMMGNTLGTCLTWYIVAEVTSSVNWAWGYHVLTIQIIVFLVIFWLVCSDYPDQNKWISKEEVELIKTAQAGRITKKRAVPPYFEIFKSIRFWAFIIAHFTNLWGLFLQLTAVPKFLVEVVGFNLRNSGIFGALPQLARLFMGLMFGFVGDLLVKREILPKAVARKAFVLCSHILPGILLMLLWLAGCDPYIAVALLTVSMGLNGASVITHLLNTQDLSPNFAGTIFSLGTLIGGTTGFICPEITSALIRNHSGMTEWGTNFIIGGIVYCSGGVFFIFFGSTNVQPWNEKKEDQETQ